MAQAASRRAAATRGKYILGMNKTRALLFLVSIAFGLTLGAWRIEHRKRVAAEASYNGRLALDSLANMHDDSTIRAYPGAIPPGAGPVPDSVIRRLQDSIAELAAAHPIETSVGQAAVYTDPDWMDAVPHMVELDMGKGKKRKQWAYEASIRGYHLTAFGDKKEDARARLDKMVRERRGRGIDVVALP